MNKLLFKTDYEARKTFSKYANYYVILKYCECESFGKVRYLPGYFNEGYYQDIYEVFQVGPRGGLKRINKIISKPNFPVYDKATPDYFRCCRFTFGEMWEIDQSLIDALMPNIP